MTSSGAARHVQGMSAAVRARTILADCRQVTLGVGETGPPSGCAGELSAAAHGPAGLLEWEERPHLVVLAGRRTPAGLVRLTCSGAVDALGVLLLAGTCDDPVPVAALPGLAPLLHGRTSGRHPVAAEDVVVVPVDVLQVRVAVPGATHHTARILPVPVELFRAARADLWALYRDDVVAHLETHHQRELRALVGTSPSLRATAAVSVRDLGADGMVLACLTPDGVAEHVVPFERAVTHPSALGAWLRAQVPHAFRADPGSQPFA